MHFFMFLVQFGQLFGGFSGHFLVVFRRPSQNGRHAFRYGWAQQIPCSALPISTENATKTVQKTFSNTCRPKNRKNGDFGAIFGPFYVLRTYRRTVGGEENGVRQCSRHRGYFVLCMLGAGAGSKFVMTRFSSTSVKNVRSFPPFVGRKSFMP